jgi:hypothetical protein
MEYVAYDFHIKRILKLSLTSRESVSENTVVVIPCRTIPAFVSELKLTLANTSSCSIRHCLDRIRIILTNVYLLEAFHIFYELSVSSPLQGSLVRPQPVASVPLTDQLVLLMAPMRFPST